MVCWWEYPSLSYIVYIRKWRELDSLAHRVSCWETGFRMQTEKMFIILPFLRLHLFAELFLDELYSFLRVPSRMAEKSLETRRKRISGIILVCWWEYIRHFLISCVYKKVTGTDSLSAHRVSLLGNWLGMQTEKMFIILPFLRLHLFAELFSWWTL